MFVDVDGTLTDAPGRPGGAAVAERVAAVRRLVAAGVPVVVWSKTGTDYARAFAEVHGIDAVACLGKPIACVDDHPDVGAELDVLSPDVLDHLEVP